MLKITSNVDTVSRNLAASTRQIPFALSKTINRLADQVQQHTTRELLPSHLTIRSDWWKPGMKYGFRVRKSTKAKLVATIGSAADWLPRQEEGATKTADGHRVAIPTLFWKKREEIMRREKKPRAILKSGDLAKKITRAERRHASLVATSAEERKVLAAARRLERLRQQHALMSSLLSKPFEATISGKAGIYVRTSQGLRMLFKLQASVQVKPRLEFIQTESDLVIGAAQRTFTEELHQALASAK